MVSNWAAFLVSTALSFFATPVLVHGLGKEQYGIWAVVMSFTGYYGLLRLGTRIGTMKYVAQYHAQGDREALNRVVNVSLLILGIASLLALGASALVATFFFHIIKADPQYTAAVRATVLLVGANVAFSFLCDVFGGVLTALKRFDLSNAVGVLSTLLRTVLMIAFVLAGYGLVAMAAIGLVVDTAANLILIWLALRLCPGLRLGLRWTDVATVRMLLRFNFYSFLCGVSDKVVNTADTIVIGAFLGAQQVAYYAIAESLARYAGSVARGISTVVPPFASEFDALGRRRELHRLVIYTIRAGMLIGLFTAVVIFFLGKPFLTLWLGADFQRAYVVLCLLMVPRIGMMSQTMVVAALVGIDRHQFLGRLYIAEAAVNLILSLLLVRPLGMVGVALGTLIPLTLTRWVIVPLYGCRVMGLPLMTYVREAMLPPLWATLPCALLAAYFAMHHPPHAWGAFFLQLVALMVVGAVLSLWFCWREQARHFLQGARWLKASPAEQMGE